MVVSQNAILRADGQSDPYWAGAASLLLHLSFLLLAMMHVPGMSGGQAGSSLADGHALLVSFVPTVEFRQKINLTPPNEEGGMPATSPSEAPVPPPDEQREIDLPKPAPAPSAIAAPEQRENAERSSSDATAIVSRSIIAVESGSPAAGQGAGLENSGLRDAYLAAVRTTILTKWGKSETGLNGCMLTLQQKIGGTVLSAQVEGCELSVVDRNELEAAALMAQPMPYAGYETVFSERLGLDLKK